MTFWANLLGYQATWFAVVWSAGRGTPWIGMLACVAFIALQWWASRTRAADGRVLLAALACGLVVDGVAAASGLLAYAAPFPSLPAPPWHPGGRQPSLPPAWPGIGDSPGRISPGLPHRLCPRHRSDRGHFCGRLH